MDVRHREAFPHKKARDLCSPLPPPRNLGTDKIFKFCHWVDRAGMAKDHWRFHFLFVVEGTRKMPLRWALNEGMSLSSQTEGEEPSRCAPEGRENSLNLQTRSPDKPGQEAEPRLFRAQHHAPCPGPQTHHQPGTREGTRGWDGKGEGTAVNVSAPRGQASLPKLFGLPFVFPKPPCDEWPAVGVSV